MDALEFLKERKRVCYLYDECDKCPFDSKCLGIINKSDEELKKIVDITEKWSKEHPRKTRQSVFLEQYPQARVCTEGVLNICPALISSAYRGNDGRYSQISKGCAACCREFWMQEVE